MVHQLVQLAQAESLSNVEAVQRCVVQRDSCIAGGELATDN